MQTAGSCGPEEASRQEPPTPLEFARAAGLLYVSDQQPGIRRLRAGRGFRYVDAAGEPVRDEQTLARIRGLVIPPAWRDVWICRSPRGHLQTTGRDARGRKQYRYHSRWREARDEDKYDRLRAFGEALGPLRQRIDEDLSLRGLQRERVVAAVVRILDEALIRVGNEEYARDNGSYGLTTFRTDHVDVSGGIIRFRFRGKSGKEHEVALNDRRAARIVRRCQDLPGQELFQYVDGAGEPRSVESADVNEYLREATGAPFTSKDFRTWGGSAAALDELWQAGPGTSATAAKRQVVEAIKTAAEKLGNTPTVCRRCYVHPAVINSYLDGSLFDRLAEPAGDQDTEAASAGLDPGERRLLRLLRSVANGD